MPAPAWPAPGVNASPTQKSPRTNLAGAHSIRILDAPSCLTVGELHAGSLVHCPALHVSGPQALPSSQALPSALATCWQPMLGTQASSVQGLPSSHPGVRAQVPAPHVSLVVQGSWSSQGAALGTWPHSPLPVQGSSVQGLPSSH